MAAFDNMLPFLAEFATPAQLGGVDVRVIFDAPYAAPFGESLDTAAPTCLLPSSAGAQRGDTIAIAGTAYRVERAEPDGTGATRLTLYADA